MGRKPYCGFCFKPPKIRDRDRYNQNPLNCFDYRHPPSHKLIIARTRRQFVLYAFATILGGKDDIYDNIKLNYCPQCGKKLDFNEDFDSKEDVKDVD